MVGSDRIPPRKISSEPWSRPPCKSSEIGRGQYGSAFSRLASSTKLREMNPTNSNSSYLRNEAQLHFVSLRSPLDYGEELSRVKMNALRAPLTALPMPKGTCLSFLA